MRAACGFTVDEAVRRAVLVGNGTERVVESGTNVIIRGYLTSIAFVGSSRAVDERVFIAGDAAHAVHLVALRFVFVFFCFLCLITSRSVLPSEFTAAKTRE